MPHLRTSVQTVLTFTALLAALASPIAVAAPAAARQGDRVTIALTSDRQYNSAVTWFDAKGRMRTQTDTPLPRQDQRSRLWSGTLVYATQSPNPRIDVMFQSMGNFARCEVWVNERRVVEQTARGKFATVSCNGSALPPAHAAPTRRHR